MSKADNVYFQYNPGNTFPIFVRSPQDEDLEQIREFLKAHKFEEVSASTYHKTLKAKKPYRMLDFSKASTSLAQSIKSVRSELDVFGAEQITPNQNYFVYRYKNVAMMVYSLKTRVWDLGYICDFTNEASLTSLSTVLKRYLGWSLAEFGVVGFWATPIEEGVLVQNQKKTNHEVVYFDTRKNLIYTNDGAKKISTPFSFIRLGEVPNGETLGMSSDELYSYLMTKTTYFSYSGIPKTLQTIIFTLAGAIEGVTYSKDYFELEISSDGEISP
jgi:hypothetical protein